MLIPTTKDPTIIYDLTDSTRNIIRFYRDMGFVYDDFENIIPRLQMEADVKYEVEILGWDKDDMIRVFIMWKYPNGRIVHGMLTHAGNVYLYNKNKDFERFNHDCMVNNKPNFREVDKMSTTTAAKLKYLKRKYND